MSHFPVLFGYPASDLGNSHVPLSLCRYWHESGRAVRLTVPSTDISIKYPWLVPVISGLKKRLVYRFGSDEQPRRMTEQFFLKNEGKAPYVYLWAALSMEIFEEFHQRGSKIIIERINCHRRTSRNILQNASAIWNIPIENTITEQAIAEEEHKLALTDSVFCPTLWCGDRWLKTGYLKINSYLQAMAGLLSDFLKQIIPQQSIRDLSFFLLAIFAFVKEYRFYLKPGIEQILTLNLCFAEAYRLKSKITARFFTKEKTFAMSLIPEISGNFTEVLTSLFFQVLKKVDRW